jgi:hypothetical protein
MSTSHSTTHRPTPDAIKAMTKAERANRCLELVPGLTGRALDTWIQTGNGLHEQVAMSPAAAAPVAPKPKAAPSLTTTEPSAKLGPKDPKPPQRRTTVPAKTTAKKPAAKKTAVRKTASKPAAKPAARKTAAKAAPASSNGHKQINVGAIVKRLKAGETMTVIRSEYGAGPKIRKALTEAGYNTKGEKIERDSISTAGGAKATAKRVANARAEGWPWYRIELATGMSERELRNLLEENGYASLAEGRVVQDREEEAPKPRKTAAKKPAAKPAKTTTRKAPAAKPAARKPAAKKAASKAKPAPAATNKPRPRRVSRPRAGA